MQPDTTLPMLQPAQVMIITYAAIHCSQADVGTPEQVYVVTEMPNAKYYSTLCLYLLKAKSSMQPMSSMRIELPAGSHPRALCCLLNAR
jgi:hypothetical protein